MNIGTDIIEISRIKKAIDDGGEIFINRIYTKNEQEYCESKSNVKYQHYAGRFAAKEAVFKAISGKTTIMSWKDIEIINNENGMPKVFLCNKETNISISISHCKEYATAVALQI